MKFENRPKELSRGYLFSFFAKIFIIHFIIQAGSIAFGIYLHTRPLESNHIILEIESYLSNIIRFPSGLFSYDDLAMLPYFVRLLSNSFFYGLIFLYKRHFVMFN